MNEINLEKMKLSELKKLAEESNLELPAKAKKQEIIDIIQKKIDELNEQIANGGIIITSTDTSLDTEEEKKKSNKNKQIRLLNQ